MRLDIGLLLLRLTLGGGMLLAHGLGKLSLMSKAPEKFPDPIGLGSEISLLMAIFSEVICTLLVIVGFRTRLAVIPLVITMLVAFFIVHGGDSFGKRELSFIYGLGFTVLYFTGSGKYSIDRA